VHPNLCAACKRPWRLALRACAKALSGQSGVPLPPRDASFRRCRDHSDIVPNHAAGSPLSSSGFPPRPVRSGGCEVTTTAALQWSAMCLLWAAWEKERVHACCFAPGSRREGAWVAVLRCAARHRTHANGVATLGCLLATKPTTGPASRGFDSVGDGPVRQQQTGAYRRCCVLCAVL